MSTSLAQQLRKLATPQSSIYKDYNKKASLLFDPKEAASIDRETFFEIGISGFTELKNINAGFSVFENSLFSVSSKDFERAMQTKDANNKLNKTIRSFLLKLSPYFLLQPTHKALEWLIHRFHIHEYNKEDIFLLILPYHDTKIFVRFIQFLNLDDPVDFWNWLSPLQKPGIPLAKIVLFNHCVSNVSFLKFLSDMVKITVYEFGDKSEILTTLFSFYCSTIVGTLENVHRITEPIISNILPGLLEYLSSPLDDLRAAGFIITAQLVSKTQLRKKTIKHLVYKIFSCNSGLNTDAVLLLHIIYETQQSIHTISEECFANLTPNDLEILCLNLGSLSENGADIINFLLAFMKGILQLIQRDTECFKRFSKLPETLFSKLNFDSVTVGKLIKCIISCYTPSDLNIDSNIENFELEILDKTDSLPHVNRNNWYSIFMKSIEQKYPSEFDKILKEEIKANNELSDEKRSKFYELIGLSPKIIKKLGDSYLFEKLYHYNSDVRIEATKYLVSDFKKLLKQDKNFLMNSIIDRLNDDDPDVVLATLSLTANEFSSLITNDILFDHLRKIINLGQIRSEWRKPSCIAVNILCSFNIDKLDYQLYFSLLPYLFPGNEESISITKMILKSHLGKYFIDNIPKLVNINDQSELCEFIFNSIQHSSHLPNISDIISVMDSCTEDNYSNVLYSVLLLSFNININMDFNDSLKLVQYLPMYFKKFELSSIAESFSEYSLLQFTLEVKRNKIPIELITYIYQKLIEYTDVYENEIWINFYDDKTDKFIISMYEIILDNQFKKFEIFKSAVLQDLVNKNFNSNRRKIEFIANIINGYISTGNLYKTIEELNILLIRSIRILGVFIKNCKLDWVFESDVLIVCLLLSVKYPELIVRQTGFEIIEFLLNDSHNRKHYFYVFLNEIFSHREELEMDHNQLPLIINSILMSDECTNENNDTKYRKNILNHLMNIVNNDCTPDYVKKSIISSLSYINSKECLISLSPLALQILEISKDIPPDVHKSEIIKSIISHINFSTYLDENTSLWQLITLSLSDTNILLIDELGNTQHVTIVMLCQIDYELYKILSLEKAQCILSKIIDLATYVNSPLIITAISKLLKKIELDVDHVLPILKNMKEVLTNNVIETPKNNKINKPSVAILNTKQWKCGITLLEYIQDKKKINNSDNMLLVLFEILKKCLDFEEQTAVEYVKQLLLTSILNCCQKTYQKNIPMTTKFLSRVLDIELIILCIRTTQNPQTHHHALLLLSYIANVLPTQVLQHMMAIFTFVGSSILKQDDAYSFQIITKIIETIIPIIIQFDDKNKSTIESRVIPVLRIFADSVLDIPEHRRLPLFKKLLETLNAEDFLSVFLCLIFESHVTYAGFEKSNFGNKNKFHENEQLNRIDFGTTLVLGFSPAVIMNTCNNILSFIKLLPEEKLEGKNDMSDTDTKEIFSVSLHTPKQLRHFKYVIITFINGILSSNIIKEEISKFDKTRMENYYKTFIVNILTYIQRVSKAADNNVGKPQAKYWKVMLYHCYEVLENSNNLLSINMFATVIRGLMMHDLMTVKRKAMEILNNKLQHHSTSFVDCEKSKIFKIMDPLLNIIKSIDTTPENFPENVNKQEIEVNQQTALLSIKLIARNFCADNPAKFKPVLDIITDLIKLEDLSGNIMASVVLCLAELCHNLKAHALSNLPKFMPSLIKILKKQIKSNSPELILLSILTALQKIIETMPLFLSPYLEKILYNLSILSAKWKDDKDTSVVTKLSLINKKISSTITPRVLIPIITQCYNLLLKKEKYDAIRPAMIILADSFIGIAGPEFISLQQDLTNFFLLALQFRITHIEKNVSSEQIDEIEDYIIKALVALILKLSESSFRPLYYKIYDWSIQDLGDNYKYRALTFYRLSSQIAENLRGLFVLFAGHFIKNAADLLNMCDKNKNDELYFESENDCCLLIEYIIKTFNSLFTYDCQNFVNKERFDTIMQSLVDQLENNVGGINSLISRGYDLIIPCISQFAIATADDSLWKPLNYQILLKTRHNDPEIRLLGLKCICEMATKLGDSWLPLLPESVPFLAELLEDDVQEIESSTQKAIQTLESILGEPLQKYF